MAFPRKSTASATLLCASAVSLAPTKRRVAGLSVRTVPLVCTLPKLVRRSAAFALWASSLLARPRSARNVLLDPTRTSPVPRHATCAITASLCLPRAKPLARNVPRVASTTCVVLPSVLSVRRAWPTHLLASSSVPTALRVASLWLAKKIACNAQMALLLRTRAPRNVRPVATELLLPKIAVNACASLVSTCPRTSPAPTSGTASRVPLALTALLRVRLGRHSRPFLATGVRLTSR